MRDKSTHFFTAVMAVLSLIFLVIAIKTLFSDAIKVKPEVKVESKSDITVVEYSDHKHIGKDDSILKRIGTVHLADGAILNSNVKWVKKTDEEMGLADKKTKVSNVDKEVKVIDSGSMSGEKLFGSLGCVACHGVAGKSMVPMFPVLAGKDAKYIVKQLKDFQSGARPSQMMKANAMKTKGNEQAIADYLSKQK